MCMTKYPEIFDALAAEFHPDRVKRTPRGYDYVTSRTVMNRLDQVLGPENWWDDYTPFQNSVICRLTIRLPDGQLLTKSDAGGYCDMSSKDGSKQGDQGDEEKGGFADALKRAAVKFGIFRYGYKDGQVVHSKLAAVTTQSTPPAVRRAITAPAVTAAQIPAAPVPPPAPPAKVASPAPAKVEAPKSTPAIKTGLQLYRFADRNRIDPELVTWLIRTFNKFPGKVSLWSAVQVEYALPEVMEHLEKMKSAKAHVA